MSIDTLLAQDIHCDGSEIRIGDEETYSEEVELYVTTRKRVKVYSSQPLTHDDAIFMTERLFDKDEIDYAENSVITDARVE